LDSKAHCGLTDLGFCRGDFMNQSCIACPSWALKTPPTSFSLPRVGFFREKRAFSFSILILGTFLLPMQNARADCNWGNGASTPQSVFNQSCTAQGGVPHGCSCDSPNTGGGNAPSGGGGMNAQQQLMMQGAGVVGNAIGQSLHDAIVGNPEEDARRAQAQAAENARRAELQRQAEQAEMRRQEEAKRRILGQLKDNDSSGELTLKTDSDDDLKVAPATGAFGQTVIVPTSATNSSPPANNSPSIGGLQLKTDDDAVPLSSNTSFADAPGATPKPDPEHLARGGRVVDCKHTRQVYQRMEAGLPRQRAMLKKYGNQIAANKAQRAAISEEARELAIKTAYDEARNLAKSMSVVRARLGRMKMEGVSPEKRMEWMRSLKDWDEFYEQIDHLPTAYTAGAQYGTDLPSINLKFKAEAARFQKMIVESDIASQAGENLAEYGFGPTGALAYDHLQYEYRQSEDTVRNDRADLAEFCSK
jgi:hypothetical protein